MRKHVKDQAGGGQAADPTAVAWARLAPRLAKHYYQMRNRSDVLGAYLPISARRPDPRTGRSTVSYTVHAGPTIPTLVRHFQGLDLVGLHVSSPAETCRWIVVDFDAHGQGDDPEANRRMALAVYRAAGGLGLDVLLLDSDGKGGYHLWIVLAGPVPMADAWRLGKWLVRDHADYGLARAPETFPKRPGLAGKRIGGLVRLPGRHHTREHWSRVWDGRRWLAGRRAIRAILAVAGRDVDLAAVIPADFEPARRAAPARQPRGGGGTAWDPPARDIALAREALGHLGDDDRDDYHTWLAVGMALRQLGEAGLELWREWSEPSAKYQPEVLDQKWAGFAAGDEAPRAGLITLGSLFHRAKFRGWAGPSRRRKPAPKTVTITIRIPKR